MTADPAALIVAFTGLLAALWSIADGRKKARKDELEQLRERVDELTSENDKLHKENIRLRQFISSLLTRLARAGIEVPTMPAFYWDAEQDSWVREPKDGD